MPSVFGGLARCWYRYSKIHFPRIEHFTFTYKAGAAGMATALPKHRPVEKHRTPHPKRWYTTRWAKGEINVRVAFGCLIAANDRKPDVHAPVSSQLRISGCLNRSYCHATQCLKPLVVSRRKHCNKRIGRSPHQTISNFARLIPKLQNFRIRAKPLVKVGVKR